MPVYKSYLCHFTCRTVYGAYKYSLINIQNKITKDITGTLRKDLMFEEEISAAVLTCDKFLEYDYDEHLNTSNRNKK